MSAFTADTLDQAKEKLHSYFKDQEKRTEEVPLFEAEGRYLAEDILAAEAVPVFPRALVDGYAVSAAETFGAEENKPVFLEEIGSAEGGAPGILTLGPGRAAAVNTGGAVPEGADAVVMAEDAEALEDGRIAVRRIVAPGDGIIKAGEDLREGQNVFSRGHRISAKDIGVLAAVGTAFPTVFAQPSVAIISTGDEIISIMEEPAPGQARDANSYALAALAARAGARVSRISLIRDSGPLLLEAVKDALNRNDLVLISGGSSAGKHDGTADAINGAGAPGVIVRGMAVKPGPTTILGVIQNDLCCRRRVNLAAGLPGHPAAAVTVFQILIRWFIKKYFFENEDPDPSMRLPVTETIPYGAEKETCLLVKIRKEAGGWAAEPVRGKPGAVSPLAEADGYILIPAGQGAIRRGQTAEVFLMK